MDYSYLLNTAVPQKEKLLEYGFIQESQRFALKKQIADGEFYVLIYLTNESLYAEVYETLTDERYALFDVLKANGSFINRIRAEVYLIINEVKDRCFFTLDLKQRYEDFLQNFFGAKPDFPWEDSPTYAVYRCQNNKWFALIMKIKFLSLGIKSEEEVWAVNIKAEPDKIASLIDNKSIFPAYHMNKKHWITVLLTAVTDFEKLSELTKTSYSLVK